MAVNNPQSASAPAPSAPGGVSPVATAAASPSPASAALSFEDLVAQELGPEPAAPAEKEKQGSRRAKPAAIAPPDESEAGDPDDDESEFDEDDDQADRHAGDPDAPETDPDPDAGEEGDGAAEEPAEDAAHEDLPPEHFKKLPAWAQKRLGKQAETVRALREELATKPFGILPTPASPLAHVETVEALQQQTDLAKRIRAWCKANPDGGLIGEVEISAEDAAAKLAHAESVLEAAPDWQSRLNRRAEMKPWEGAKRVCPELFEPGTEQNQFAEMALKMCPELKTKLPNWEMFLAAAARSIQQMQEEEQGKAKYVRMEMKDGKPVTPQRAGSAKPGTPPAPLAGARAGTARPPSPAPVARAKGNKPDTAVLADRYANSRDPDDFAALVAAELG